MYHRRQYFFAAFFALAFVFSSGTIAPDAPFDRPQDVVQETVPTEIPPVVPTPEVVVSIPTVAQSTHQPTPDPLRGIYLTGWTAGTTKGLNRAFTLIDEAAINAVIIDIKDATGRLSYQPQDSELIASGVGTNRIRDLSGLIAQLHARGVYVIGRLTVFQDPFYAQSHPEDTFTDTRTGALWTDYKNIAWLRPDRETVWDYTAAVARDAYAQGFDEINLDYVRYPSDGPLQFIDLTHMTKSKAEVIADFFVGMDQRLRQEGIPVSADVFGLTMSAKDDVGIGQKAVLIAPSVDALAPMLYPSHFWNGTYGIPVPAKEPYKVIYKSLSDGIAKLAAAGIPKEKLRPWFQDFDLLGISYTPDMVRAQIDAARDLGINSWMMWDPRGYYRIDAYQPVVY